MERIRGVGGIGDEGERGGRIQRNIELSMKEDWHPHCLSTHLLARHPFDQRKEDGKEWRLMQVSSTAMIV